jgi:hypothetical protein
MEEASRFPAGSGERHQSLRLETVAHGHVLDPTWIFGEEAA